MPELTLFARLRELFAQDPLIDEIGLVLGVDEPELTPENAFVLEDHKLGVALSAGPPLFRQARSRFHELNPSLRQTGDADESLVADLVDCTRAVLLISADFYTAWNTRKELVRRGRLDALAETQFCDLVFSLHPKSIDTWAYRRWLATQLLASAPANESSTGCTTPLPLAGDARHAFYHRQLEVCSRLAEQKPRNYHAWSFRHWIVSRLPREALARELEEMRRWCAMHITDHSGWNHRQHVVREDLRARHEAAPPAADGSGQQAHAAAAVQVVLVAEYAFVSEIMAAFPTHEALWCHRRFVAQLVLTTLGSARGAPAAPSEALVQALGSLEARVVSAANGASGDGVLTSEQLTSAWRRVEEALGAVDTRDASARRLQVLLAIVQEVDVAWRVATRFSRRFALWCLERVRVLSEAEEPAAAASLLSLATALRRQLESDDPLLRELWLAPSA